MFPDRNRMIVPSRILTLTTGIVEKYGRNTIIQERKQIQLKLS